MAAQTNFRPLGPDYFMTRTKQQILCLVVLLLALGAFFLERFSDHAFVPGQGEVIVAESGPVSESEEQPAAPVSGDEDEEGSATQTESPHSHPMADEGFIRKTLSETWTDTPEKRERRRVRIVEADFKYPRLRLEETVATDAKPGDPEVLHVRASVADHLMVGLKKGVSQDSARAALVAMGYQVRSADESHLLIELSEFAAAGDQAENMERLLELDEFVDFAEPDWIVHTFLAPDDPAFTQGRMWAFDNPGRVAGTVPGADIDAKPGWAARSDASSVIVAVTDTGIRHTHQDLAPNMWTNGSGHHGFDAYDDDDNPTDPNGHGTHCAGTIGARGNNGVGTAGVAWNVQLMALRFIGPNGGTNSDAIRVINYARQNGAHIINASWGGGGFSQGLSNAISACHDAGIAFVAAAGNYTSDNDVLPMYPSAYRLPNVVSVASTDSADELSFFSNYGKNHVHLAAPGHDIWSCGIKSDSHYQYLSGTSMATPHVAGALALARAHFPGESVADLITRLHSAVDKLPSLDGRVTTGGRLNLRNLLLHSDPLPGHDSFDTPFDFEGSDGIWIGTNERASREPDENAFSPDTGERSLWFRWTAPGSGLVRFTASAGSGDVSVVVFEGDTRGGLKRIQDNFPRRPASTSHLYFYAEEAAIYRFAVDSRLQDAQSISVELSQQPPNDNFADAQDLGPSQRIATHGTNRGATAESFELAAPHAGVGAGKSVWWKWTPNFSGEFILSTRLSPFDTVLAVYQGSSSANLLEVASNDDLSKTDWTSEVRFPVTAGTTYHIAVDSYRGASTGDILLNGYRPGELVILKHPDNQTVKTGGTADFRVVAVGNKPRFQWELGGKPVPGAVQAELTIRNVDARDYGNYRVRITDGPAQVTSLTATLSEFITPPAIIWQTRSRSVSAGDAVKLRVRASGSLPLGYQWFKNDVVIQGATNDLLDLGHVTAADEAGYTVVVSNSAGNATSERIVLRIFVNPWNAWHFVDPASQTSQVFAIEKFGDIWLAAANTTSLDSLRLSTSDDGKNWTHQFLEPQGSVPEVAGKFLIYGNGFWLCGGPSNGWNPTGVFFKSTDGLSWQQITPVMNLSSGGTVNSSSNMLFHDGYFYLTAANRVYRSADGVSWIKQLAPSNSDIIAYKIFAGAPGVLAEGDSSTQLWFLANGSSAWQAITVDPLISGATARISEMFWNTGQFIVYNSSSIGYASQDGINWTKGSDFPSGVRYSTWRASHGNLAYAGGSTQDWLSTDGGVSWTAYNQLFPPNTRAAAIHHGLAVFGSNKGALTAVEDLFATDAYPEPLFVNSLTDLVYEGGQFIATNHSSIIAVSADGETWTKGKPKNILNPETGFAGETAPIFINGEFWRVGYPSGSAPYYPYFRGPVPSAANIATLPSAPDDSLTAIAGGPAGVVAIRINKTSSQGAMVRSVDDGVTWNTITAPGAAPSRYGKLQNVNDVYFYNAYFGSAYVSTDLLNWTDIGDYTHLLYHEGEYWAFHQTTVKRSTDLVNWTTPVQTGMAWFGKPVSFNGAVVVPIGGKLHYSSNGINWVRMNLGFTASFVAASNNVLIVASDTGHLARTSRIHIHAPSVSIAEPVEESGFVDGSVISVRVDASNPNDSGDPVLRCFYDGVLIGELNAPPYAFEIPSGKPGGHLIHVECQQGNGPVSLATRHIIVRSAHLVNHINSIDGQSSLPGTVVYRNGIYIAYELNSFLGSIDGRAWHAIAMPTSMNFLRGVVAGDDHLIAFGTTSQTGIAVTRDGVNWTAAKLPKGSQTPLYHSHGYFWGITSGGAASDGIILSEDGVNWKYRNIMVRPATLNEACGDPNGILLGRSTNNFWRSADGGRTWQNLSSLSSLNGLTYEGGRFFVKADINGQRHVGSSSNGLDWVWHGPDSRLMELRVVNGTAFAFNTLNRLVALSYDGLTWLNVPNERRISNLTWGMDGYFHAVVVVPETGQSALHRSLNGIEWEYRAPLPVGGTFNLLATPEGLFISPGNGALWMIQWDSDQWTQPFTAAAGAASILELRGGGGKVMAIDANGTRILASSDGGDTWKKVFDRVGSGLPTSLRLNTLQVKDGVWLAWHKGVALLRSQDGESFQNITTQAGAATFETFAHNGTSWMAIRNDGAVLVSSNGLDWALHAGPGSYPDATVYQLMTHQGNWYALSRNATTSFNPLRMFSSTDGLVWTQTSMPGLSDTGVKAMASANGGIIAGGGSFRYSGDLANWTNTTANSSVFSHHNAFYIVNNGWLEKSTNGTTWVRELQVGTQFTNGRSIGGSLYVFGASAVAKISSHDMAVHQVRATAAEYAVGDTVEVEFVLSNEGSGALAAGDYQVNVFLSLDGFYGNDDDSAMGRAIVTVPPLLPGQSAILTITAIIPNLTTPGTHRVGVYFDREGARLENNRSNNFGISTLPSVTIPGWLLTTTALGDGDINRDSSQRLLANGSRVSLNATAGKGASFNGWLGDALGTESQITLLMNGDKNVLANFSPQASLRILIRGHGHISGAGESGLFAIGETAMLQASPGDGWVFAGWSGAATGDSPSASVLMDQAKTITARFLLTREAWKARHFTSAELANPAISGDDADPDHNGLTNLQEYLHASNPRDPQSRGVLRTTMEGGYLSMVFTRLAEPDIGFSLKSAASRDLTDWSSSTPHERVLGTENGVETVEARLPSAGGGKGFLRLNYYRNADTGSGTN
jgi:subtilisin family serine protease